MSRKYAIDEIPGLAGRFFTSVEGEIIPAGEELPEGTETFDVTFWYYPTPADIEAGATPGVGTRVALHGIDVNDTNREIRRAILELRAMNREEETFGYGGQIGFMLK